MRNRFQILFILTFSIILPVLAQVPTALVVEGAALPGAPVGHVVDAINNSGVNHDRGYAFTVNSIFETVNYGNVWGGREGDIPGPMFTESTYGDFEQTSFESFFGISNNGLAAYSPVCIDLISGMTGLDCVWVDDVPVAVETHALPNDPNYYYSFNSRPGMLANSEPVWVAGLTNTPEGSTQQRAIMRGMDSQIILKGGDMIPGLPWPIADTGLDFDFRFSAQGSHYITPVTMNTGSTNDDGYIIVDGSALQIAGTYVAENTPVPVEAGGLPGELWGNFDFVGVTESGRYMITGDTNAASVNDEFVLVDGTIVLREGDMIGGLVINGGIQGAYFNDNGDYAVTWDLDDGTGNTFEVLILNGDVILQVGDEVDFDGDGLPDPGILVTDFTGISSLTLGDRDENSDVQVAFTADVEVPDFAGSSNESVVADLDKSGLEELPVGERGVRGEVECGFLMHVQVATAVDDLPINSPHLASNWPNPFNPKTHISFNLPAAGSARLDILSVDGRLINTLLSGELAAGEHRVTWSGRDLADHPVASGIYLYRLSASDWSETKTMVLLK